jgi:hypothetical protein
MLEHIFELFLFILSILSILSTKQASLSREISLEKELGAPFCWYGSAISSKCLDPITLGLTNLLSFISAISASGVFFPFG